MKRIFLAAAALMLTACASDMTAPSNSIVASLSVTAPALSPCIFTTSGTTETLTADCVTDQTIAVPNGMTLNGNGHTITGVDPAGGHFIGAVVRNGGVVANVKNLVVTVSDLADVCDAYGDRLRGIMFDGASGSIIGNTVHDLRQVASGCQEGNSIEVRNSPFDGTHPATMSVEISNNTVTNFMKTGILANGDVNANVHNNVIGASANQTSLAANSIQLGFGAAGTVKANQVAGNQWCQTPDDDATGILLYSVASVTVTQNVFSGNADIGIYMLGSGLTVNNNKVYDDGSITDCNLIPDDVGIWNDGTGNQVTNNKVGGFTKAYVGVTSGVGKNKTNPNK